MTQRGNLRIQLFFDGDKVWTTQKRIAEIFQVEVNTISYHLKEIFDSGELNRYSVVRKDWITAADGKKYETKLYNLDVIIAVGYRVNSYKATPCLLLPSGLFSGHPVLNLNAINVAEVFYVVSLLLGILLS